MNVFIVTHGQILHECGHWSEYTSKEFFPSLAPNFFYRGLSYYFRLLRLNRYGVDGWGSREEIDRMEAEDRARLFPVNCPLSA